ncbi:hypothetical protein G7Y41_03305 [Schaalia sp. ZJ405]|uniref:hypothetical protein n=1 Tax=unclassified Schaalia TaxID=2691889 RepID=UPI0013EB12A6|nr:MULTISPECIES: hypothetical protein [unclassified Schaalia]QPK81864.1 hypothetical protein G7Y41_03305 [Schaalia sp. ZJ405]
MSAAQAATRPASRPQRLHAEERELRIIEGQRSGRSYLVVAAITIVVIVVAVVSSMVLNTRMAQTSFAIREQQLLLNELDAQAWSLQARLESAASPAALEKAAKEHGMVPSGSTGFITLKTGTVEGGAPAN